MIQYDFSRGSLCRSKEDCFDTECFRSEEEGVKNFSSCTRVLLKGNVRSKENDREKDRSGLVVQ